MVPRLVLVLLVLAVCVVGASEAAEKRCDDPTAGVDAQYGAGTCICSEPLQATAYPGGPDFYNPNDTTVKQCDGEVGGGSGLAVTRPGGDIVVRSDATALAALPNRDTGAVQRYLSWSDGHLGINFMGHIKSPLGSTKRIGARWYRWYPSNFQFSTEGSCQASKIAQMTGFLFDTHGGPVQAYGWYTFGWTPNIDCCGDGQPGGGADPTGQALAMSPSIYRGKWWRFEFYIDNPQGGAAPNGLKFYMFMKDVTTPGAVEFKAIDSTIPEPGGFAQPWTTQATTSLTPPGAQVQFFHNGYRQTSCAGYAGILYYMMAAWNTTAGQRIGSAIEVEASGGGPPPVNPPAAPTGLTVSPSSLVLGSLVLLVLALRRNGRA